MNDIFDVLETCLQELENGAEVESVLARYPQLAAELRPILMASIMARGAAVPEPSPEAIRRGRTKVLQHAAQMREAKVAPRSKRMIPIFQRLAIAFTLTALFLSSGTGLVSASSSALPGENLYPVKLTWENVRLFFTFDEEYRETLEHTFENERLHEVNELLVEGRHETIQFAGIYMEVNGITYVSGIHVVVLDTSILPTEPLLNGVAVVITGRTNAEGFVDIESLELLPAGTVVPPGEPVEVETEDNSDGDDVNKGTKVENNDNDVKNDASTGDQSPATDGERVNDNGNDSNENSTDDNANTDSSDGGDDNGDDKSNDNADSNDDGGDDNSGSGGGGDDNSGDGNDD